MHLRTRRKLAWGLLLLLVAAVVIAAGIKIYEGKRKQLPLPTVDATPQVAAALPAPRVPVVLGSVVASREAKLSAPVEGIVRSLIGELGRKVTKGEVLVELDDREVGHMLAEASARVDELVAREEEAKAELADWESMAERESSSVSQTDLRRLQTKADAVAAQLEGAEARKEVLRAQHEKHQILAPFAGKIQERFVERGEHVLPGTPLVCLIALDPIHVSSYLTAEELVGLKNGDALGFTADAHSDHAFKGRLVEMAPAADEKTRRYRVVLTVVQDDEFTLRPGMICRVTLAPMNGE